MRRLIAHAGLAVCQVVEMIAIGISAAGIVRQADRGCQTGRIAALLAPAATDAVAAGFAKPAAVCSAPAKWRADRDRGDFRQRTADLRFAWSI
jgi:hypothetical protein